METLLSWPEISRQVNECWVCHLLGCWQRYLRVLQSGAGQGPRLRIHSGIPGRARKRGRGWADGPEEDGQGAGRTARDDAARTGKNGEIDHSIFVQ